MKEMELGGFNLIWQIDMCDQVILRCKGRKINWKYLTVGFGRLLYDMAYVVGEVWGTEVKYRVFIGNM